MDERRFELALRACGFIVKERNHSPKIAMFTLAASEGKGEGEARKRATRAFREWKGEARGKGKKRKWRKFDSDFAIVLS